MIKKVKILQWKCEYELKWKYLRLTVVLPVDASVLSIKSWSSSKIQVAEANAAYSRCTRPQGVHIWSVHKECPWTVNLRHLHTALRRNRPKMRTLKDAALVLSCSRKEAGNRKQETGSNVWKLPWKKEKKRIEDLVEGGRSFGGIFDISLLLSLTLNKQDWRRLCWTLRWR